jgi:hypothetical protein
MYSPEKLLACVVKRNDAWLEGARTERVDRDGGAADQRALLSQARIDCEAVCDLVDRTAIVATPCERKRESHKQRRNGGTKESLITAHKFPRGK